MGRSAHDLEKSGIAARTIKPHDPAMAAYIFAGELPSRVPSIGRHVHRHWELVCYIEGEGVLTVGDQPIAFRPGTVVAQPPLIPHDEVSPGGFRCLYLGYVDGEPSATVPVCQEDEAHSLSSAMRLLIREDRLRAPGWERMTEHLLACILTWMRRWSASDRDPLIDRAETMLLDAWRDPTVTVAAIARDLGLSVDRLCRRYRAATGMTPRERLTHIRITKAKSLLAQGHGVAETAALVGFTDPFWFSRQFHRITGAPPRSVRRLAARPPRHGD